MIYFIILALLGFLALFEYFIPVSNNGKATLINFKRNSLLENSKIIIYFLIVLILIIFAGIRYYSGFDYVNYVRIFKRAMDSIRYLNVEYGYYLLNKFLGFVTNNAQVIFLVMAILILAIKGFIIKKRSRAEFLSIYLYFAMYFLVYDMGQIRSSLAQALTFLAIYLYIDKKVKSSIVLILIAATFHTSALIILLIFLFRDKWISDKIALIIVGASVIIGQLLDLNKIGAIAKHFNGPLAHKIYEYTASSKYAVKIGLSSNVIFDVVIFAFILYMRKRYKQKGREFNVLFNCYLLAISVYLLFNNYFVIAVRLSDYFRLSLLILIPMLLYLIENKTLRYIVLFILIIVLAAMVYRQINGNIIYYLPYRVNLFHNYKLTNVF